MHGLAFALFLSLTQAPFWCPKGMADDPDAHAAFRGAFETTANPCTIRLLGASEYLVWLDGKLIEDGPARFAPAHPEYQTEEISLKRGRHVLAIHAHNDGVSTRVLPKMPPFLWCQVSVGQKPIIINWKCARIPGYQPRTRRISDNLGWIDWCDTSKDRPGWKLPQFDDSKWASAVEVDPGIGPITEAKTHPVSLNKIELKPIAQGKLTENFGYEQDDPAVRFFLADLEPKETPAQGVWRRYDLGRVRLGRPDFTLDLPKGAKVEYALCEQLRHGRVHAWITLSGSESCNFDHFVARGGAQEFMPFTPKGGRYLEIHIITPKPIRFLNEGFLERTYFGQPEGSFTCDDPLLNQIWSTGVETMRACSEDSFVDCPTRERGEWTGDVASVATDIDAVAYSDLSLARRALVQAAQSARPDGLVAGLEPGTPAYLSTYAAQWVSACVHYWELSGDKSLLQELLGPAERNMAAFNAKMTPEGLQGDLGWAFVDWGYVPNPGPSDMALNIEYFMALKAMARWHRAFALEARAQTDETQASEMAAIIKSWIVGRLKAGNWPAVEYHRAALALLAGLVDRSDQKACVRFIESHLLTCFPNDESAPRLSDPSQTGDRFMTPYFCHFALTALLEHGETDFVLSQYRKCWGWALGQATTWLEVFDPRWSHCHEWSGCPTWQLTRYILGFRPRFDLGEMVYDVRIQTGNLKRAYGDIPLPDGEKMHVGWLKEGGGVRLHVKTSRPVRLRIGGREVVVAREYDARMTS